MDDRIVGGGTAAGLRIGQARRDTRCRACRHDLTAAGLALYVLSQTAIDGVLGLSWMSHSEFTRMRRLCMEACEHGASARPWNPEYENLCPKMMHMVQV